MDGLITEFASDVDNLEQDEQKKKLMDFLDKFSSEEAYEYLTEHVGNSLDIDLPQKVVDILMKKISEAHNTEESFGFSGAYDFFRKVSLESWSWKDKDEFLIEKIYRTLPGLSKDYHHFVHELENLIGQEYVVRPKILMEVVREAYSNRDIDLNFRSSLLHSFNYQYAFESGGEYDKAILESLDFDHEEKFGETIATLRFLRGVFLVGSEEVFSEDKVWNIVKCLDSAVSENKGSYFLNKLAGLLSRDMKNSYKGWTPPQQETFPFLIAPETYAFFNYGKLTILNKDKNNELVALLAEYKKLDEDIYDSQEYKDAVKRGDDHFLIPRSVTQSKRDLFKKIQDLFLSNQRNTFVGKSQKDILDYEFIVSPQMKEILKAECGIPIDELDIDTQFQLLNFLKSKNTKEMEGFKIFVKNYSNPGLKTFLSLEYGRDFGEKIIEMGEKLPKEMASKIFDKYSSFVDEVNRFKNTLKGEDKEVSPKVFDKVLRRGRDLLELFAGEISEGGFDEQKMEKLLRNLDNVSSEAVLMQSVVMGAREDLGEGVSFNDLPDIHHFTGENYTITEEQAERIREIYRENYKDRPKMLEKLLEGFDKSLEKENAEFHTLFFRDKLIGVMVFEFDGEQVYFGKFNLDPKFQGGKIGEQFMVETVDDLAKDHIISATCSVDAPVTTKYIERGFVAEGVFDFEEDKSFNIVRNDNSNNLFFTKSLEEEKIIDNAIPNSWNDFEDGTCSVLLVDYKDLGKVDFSRLQENSDSRWVLTRFFKRNGGGGEKFAVLVMEKVAKDKFEEYKNKLNRPAVLETRSSIII